MLQNPGSLCNLKQLQKPGVMIDNNIEGINPTAEFIASQHTGKFFKILPGVYMIKGAKNNDGFSQGYAISNGKRKELLLIDVVEEASRQAVKTIVKEGYEIKAIAITGEKVLKDSYADLDTLSQEAGGADIYMHSHLRPGDGTQTKVLNSSDALIKSFTLEVIELPQTPEGSLLLFSSKNEGMLFTGDNARGSGYDSDNFSFNREKMEKQEEEFKLASFWQKFNLNFTYLFPRSGKPAIEVDGRTRSNILNRIKRGGS